MLAVCSDGSIRMTDPLGADSKPFHVEEATIDGIARAIRAGRTNCVDIVRQYIARARAYNGVASLLVTEDGASVPEAVGAVRAGAPLVFPTETVAAATLFPDLDKYQGPPLEFGRMEPTASDPSVEQQYGMIVGKPGNAQLNALATLNIRGERSVTCKGDFDRHPSLGDLPPGAPPVCEMFRHYPDALERAAELDAQYGTNPPLDEMPMYGVVFSFKDPFDTKDMRTTGGGDAAYDIDFPARDHILVEQLRDKGAIIFAKAVCTEYNGRAGNPGGRHRPDKVLPSVLGYQRSSWGGNPANVYDTTRSRLARLVVGVGRLGQRQSRDGEPRRGDPRLDPRPGQPQSLRADTAAQGDARLRRRRDRRRYLLRPQRHHLPHHRRLRQGARRAEGPATAAITTRATRSRPCRAHRCWRAAMRATRGTPRPGTERHADRHRPRVDAGAARRKGHGADHAGCGGRDQIGAWRQARR